MIKQKVLQRIIRAQKMIQLKIWWPNKTYSKHMLSKINYMYTKLQMYFGLKLEADKLPDET